MASPRKVLFTKKAQMTSLDDCKSLSAEIFSEIELNSIVLLSGDMGAGKTQWTKFLLENLGYTEVESPTFSLHNIYSTNQVEVHHFDLHRLESDEELDQIGLWEALSDSSIESSMVIVEWPDRIRDKDLPRNKPVLKINIDKQRALKATYYAAEE